MGGLLLIDRLVFGAPFIYSRKGISDVSRKSQEFRNRIEAQDQRLFAQIADYVAQLVSDGEFSGFFDPEVTLVPVPGHTPLVPGAKSTSERIAVALKSQGLGAGVSSMLKRTAAVTKSAYARPSDRPRSRDHFDTMAVERSRITPTRILLGDDFVTRGATSMGAAMRIKTELPRHRR